MKIITLFPLVFIMLLFGCSQQTDNSKLKSELLRVDREFSARSAEAGNNQAFIEYAAPEAVLLKKNYYPIVGKREIREHLENIPDSTYTLTWKPSYAKVAESGELGYTFGVYTMKTVAKPVKTYHGTYVTIWEKNNKDQWRFVLDSGNSGTGEEGE